MSKGFSANLNEEIVYSPGGIYSKVLGKTDSSSYTLMCLSKGSSIDTHTSTKKGAVYVISGKGTFTLFEREIELKPGVFIYMPENAPHSLAAEEDMSILLCLG